MAFYRAKAEITEVLRFAQHDSIFEDGLCCRPIRTLMVNKLLKINWLSAGTRGDRPESMVEGEGSVGRRGAVEIFRYGVGQKIL